MAQKIVESSIGLRLPEKTAIEVDNIVKSLPQECKNIGVQRKSYTTDDIHFEPGERAEVSIVSTESVDKTNEVVLVAGLELNPYRKSGSVLWNHDEDMPIAFCEWIIQKGSTIRAKTVYPKDPETTTVEKSEEEDSSWFPDYVWKMTKAGALKGKSIGFLPMVPKRDPTNEELELHPEWAGAGIWEEGLLLEYSCCSVGINNDALVEAVNTKSLDLAKITRLGIELKSTEQVQTVTETVTTPAETKSIETIDNIIFKASDPCVSQKIKHMYDKGEDSKYSRAQIIAIAYSYCNKKKSYKPKQRQIRPERLEELYAAAIEKVDYDKIKKMAQRFNKNRGKV